MVLYDYVIQKQGTKTMSMVIKMFALGRIFYDWTQNTRYPGVPKFDVTSTESKSLINSLIETKGFSPSLAPVVASPITPAQLKVAMSYLQAEWDDLKAKKEEGPNDEGMRRLIAWEKIHVSKGKLIEPELFGATGNRRWFANREAFSRVFRDDKKLSLKDIDKVDYSLEVPVHVIEFASAVDRLGKQLEENELRSIGVLDTSYVDNLNAINAMMPTGKITQSFLRQSMGATSGQKYWHFLRLNNAFPSLDLINRVKPEKQEAGVAGGYLSWTRLGSKFSELVKISIAADPMKLPEYNADMERRGKPDDKLTALTTADDVDGKLRQLMVETSGNKPKQMERKGIEGIANSPSRVQALVAKQILDTKTGGAYADRLGAEQIALNAVDVLFDDKTSFPVVETFLDSLSKAAPEVRSHVLSQLAQVSFEVPAPKAKAKGKGKQ